MIPRYFRPLVLLFAVAMAPLALSPAAHGQLITPGNNFRLVFDLSSAGLPPPYDQLHPVMNFDASNLFGGPGDAFTVQTFDSHGTALSSAFTVSGWPEVSNPEFAVPILFAPFTSTQGYFLFTDIMGSFVLGPDQFVIGYHNDPLAATGRVRATVELVSVPEPSTYGAWAGMLVLVFAAWRRFTKVQISTVA